MTITVNTRELLRNFKHYRDRLIRGEIDTIEIPQNDNVKIQFTLVKNVSPTRELFAKLEARSEPIHIERPEEDIIWSKYVYIRH